MAKILKYVYTWCIETDRMAKGLMCLTVYSVSYWDVISKPYCAFLLLLLTDRQTYSEVHDLYFSV